MIELILKFIRAAVAAVNIKPDCKLSGLILIAVLT